MKTAWGKVVGGPCGKPPKPPLLGGVGGFPHDGRPQAFPKRRCEHGLLFRYHQPSIVTFTLNQYTRGGYVRRSGITA